MGLFRSEIKTANDLFTHTLRDIYYAEHQIVKNLPTMTEKAKNPELKSAFQEHLTQTKGHVQRLDRVFQQLGIEAKAVTCRAMDGILAEAEEIMGECDDENVRDAAMLAAAQAVEHYEMARYGTLIAMANQLGKSEVVSSLQETLEEEKQADKKLSGIAVNRVNKMAAE